MGGAAIEFRTGDEARIGALKRRFEGFGSSSSGPDAILVYRPGEAGPAVEWDGTGRVVTLRTAATLDHVDSILRNLLPQFLAPAIVAHAALLTDANRGYLCCGVSGSGKSTLAALCGDRALCDELALVRASTRGFEGVSLPYWRARPGHAPLAGVFVLEHGPENVRTRLGAPSAVRELRRHFYWPVEQASAFADAFETLSALASSVPVWRLAFRPDPSVWDLITAPA
ncbi:MAG: hypothetical protein GXP48_10340 [Acidobacteria bacterium]|nr:hypothetical protein [Acidobacteriota bacterium]